MSLFDNLDLQQYPTVKGGQAFNSADTLLLEAARLSKLPISNTLIANDEFGALCLALRAPRTWTDSQLAKLSLEANLVRNEREPVEVLWSTCELSSRYGKGQIAQVLIRVPKQLAYFEYQLSQLSRVLTTGTSVLAAGMDKHLSPATARLLETYIGPTERHRGKRKARLFSAVRDNTRGTYYSGISETPCPTLNMPLTSLANVFSRDKIDGGSQFFIDNMSLLAPSGNVIDLACGNGILGLNALALGRAEKLLLCDESAMAIASAEINAAKLGCGEAISFHHGDGLLHYSGEPAELILCNPPFHLNHAVDEGVGRRLLAQAAPHIVAGGTLCLVANRHLNYQPLLRKKFASVEKLVQNARFIIWKATR